MSGRGTDAAHPTCQRCVHRTLHSEWPQCCAPAPACPSAHSAAAGSCTWRPPLRSPARPALRCEGRMHGKTGPGLCNAGSQQGQANVWRAVLRGPVRAQAAAAAHLQCSASGRGAHLLQLLQLLVQLCDLGLQGGMLGLPLMHLLQGISRPRSAAWPGALQRLCRCGGAGHRLLALMGRCRRPTWEQEAVRRPAPGAPS